MTLFCIVMLLLSFSIINSKVHSLLFTVVMSFNLHCTASNSCDLVSIRRQQVLVQDLAGLVNTVLMLSASSWLSSNFGRCMREP